MQILMSNKTIQLNPMFLSSGKALTPTRQKKEKPQTSLKPNKMKKQLLAKIKDFQNKTEKEQEAQAEEADEEEVFADEFNKSLNFLSALSKQRKQKPLRNETLKKGKIEREIHLQIATELPEEMKPTHINKKVEPKPVTVSLRPLSHISHISAAPAPAPVSVSNPAPAPVHVSVSNPVPVSVSNPVPLHVSVSNPISVSNQVSVSNQISTPHNQPAYSNLKNGTKPTYRQYHNTTQKIHGHSPVAKPLIHINTEPDSNTINASNTIHTINAQKQRFKKRITRTLKYSLGKHKNGKVSVLIKNATTRRKVQTEQALLKQKSIADIKVYLRGKNLLKVGSDVPNDVLRQLYENAILAGDVTNKSKDTLIHNYFHEK